MADNLVKGTSTASNGAGQDAVLVSTPDPGVSAHTGFWRNVRELIGTIRNGDESMVEAVVVQLSHQRRIFAPLALAVGALAMLFDCLRLLLFSRSTFMARTS